MLTRRFWRAEIAARHFAGSDAAALLLVWQIVVTARNIPAVVLPPPVEIAHELWPVLPVLLRHAVPTTLDSLMAFFTASALGIGLAVAITYSPFLRDMLYPNLVFFQLPKGRAGAAVRRLAWDQQRVARRLCHL